MLESIYILLAKTNDIKRSTYVWNAINAMVLAMQTPIFTMVLTRTNGVEDAGIYSIAIAVANLMLFLGQYGLRRYQSSDITQKFSFGEYHAMRLITSGTMALICLFYCLYCVKFNNYSWYKFSIVFLICMVKVIQAYTDVLHGHLQQVDRLDIAGKAATVRYVSEIAVYVVVLTMTSNLFLAALICLVVTTLEMLTLSLYATAKHTDSIKPHITMDKFKLLAIEGFPLFVSTFLNMYISNAPKYAIDAYMTDSIQAVYNMIFMPTYVIQMVTQFIFNPVLTTYADLWLAHSKEQYKKLVGMIKKMSAMVFGLIILALIVAATIGLPVLSVLFGVDLTPYKTELMIIMIGGGMLGYSVYFYTIIAVIRAQRALLICYGISALSAKMLSGFFVTHYGMLGAATVYAAIMGILTIALFFVTVWNFRKEKREIFGE